MSDWANAAVELKGNATTDPATHNGTDGSDANGAGAWARDEVDHAAW